MYEDNEKRKKIYVESNCVSRDDCCWDETPEMQAAVSVNEKSPKQPEPWPEHWTKQL
jgi:hypothetical protein